MGFFILRLSALLFQEEGTMKRYIYLLFTVNLVILFSLVLSVNAESMDFKKSHTIRVSCRIPEIPGVNVPLIEEEIYKQDNIWENEDKAQPQISKKPLWIQETTGRKVYTLYVL